MTNEEYDRIKAAEKEHLRKMKELKEAARRLERSRKTQDAAADVDRAQDALDENSALVRRLSKEAARTEARLDLALEASEEPAEDPVEDDPKARARDLVRRLREEMNADADRATPASKDSPTDERPDKTFGRLQ